MRRLISAFVVRKPSKTGFLTSRSIYSVGQQNRILQSMKILNMWISSPGERELFYPTVLLAGYWVETVIIWALTQENLALRFANNKGTDKPVHPHSLISAFVIHLLKSIICKLTREISIYYLVCS